MKAKKEDADKQNLDMQVTWGQTVAIETPQAISKQEKHETSSKKAGQEAAPQAAKSAAKRTKTASKIAEQKAASKKPAAVSKRTQPATALEIVEQEVVSKKGEAEAVSKMTEPAEATKTAMPEDASKKEEPEKVIDKRQSLFLHPLKLFKAKRSKRLAEIENAKLSAEQNKLVKEKVEEASKEVSKSSSKKTKIKNILFFIFNLALVAGILIWNVMTTDDFSALDVSKVSLLNFLYVLLFLAVIVILDVMSVHRMIYRKTMRSRWKTSYKALGVMRYYDAVTPMSSGGQAFMVTYLTARDIPGSTSLSIPISKLLFQNISWITITGVCLVLSFARDMGSLVSAASIIGFILALGMVLFIMFVSFSKKLGNKLVSWGVKLCAKMHIVKNYDKTYAKVKNFVEDYQNIMKEYSHAKFDVFIQLVLHAARSVCLFSIPYFIYKIFPFEEAAGYPMGDYGTFFIYTAMIDLASSFIPLPGGTGMNEITFSFLFSSYLGGNTFWALLLWRFCSYYFYLLQGIGILAYDTVYGNRKYRWVKKCRELQDESQEFRKIQIDNFRRQRNNRRKKMADKSGG